MSINIQSMADLELFSQEFTGESISPRANNAQETNNDVQAAQPNMPVAPANDPVNEQPPAATAVVAAIDDEDDAFDPVILNCRNKAFLIEV